jgi:hypothetical protein
VALPGTKPVADRSQVRRTNKPTPGTEWVEVEDVPFDGPPLPTRDVSGVSVTDAGVIPGSGWPASTLEWWEAVRTMPHAVKWKRADWATAVSAAEAHARFAEAWRGCASGAELRAREKQLGMTADARRDLRIRYVSPKDAPDPGALPAGVTQLDDYRGL